MLLSYIILLVFSTGLFLYAFFPLPNSTSNFDNKPPTRIGNISVNYSIHYKPHFQKFVLMVIDALRWDFVTNGLMPLTANLMNQKGCLSKISVESPTVTLPRIKALTTGSVPQYIDVVKNLATAETLTDSWLHSARDKGLQTVFYGDNTWEKLFPGFFARQEGTSSFFVWDFHEVDSNVTRNVKKELEGTDWDIMILHYLGLDHIGHVLGPFSEKVPVKLKEMDDVVDEIYKNTLSSSTLIFITGDHGMQDAGGHGGTSEPEVTVPLIAIGLDCLNSSFQQTDIPTNLAVLLGLDIPSTSVGKVQKAFLNQLNPNQYLYALRYNIDTLIRKISTNTDFHEATEWHEKYLQSSKSEDAEKAIILYENGLETITKQLIESSSEQNVPLLIAVCLVMVILLCAMRTSSGYFEVGFYFFTISILFIFSKVIYVFLPLLLVLTCTKLKQVFSKCTIPSLGYLIAFIHPWTFISSSFIEEEHYFWIFVSVTYLILACVTQAQQTPSKTVNVLVMLFLLRFSMDLNSTIENFVPNKDNWSYTLKKEDNLWLHQLFYICGLMLVFVTFVYEKTPKPLLTLLTLTLIFILKSLNYHNPLLGKTVWILILFQKMLSRNFSFKHCWILAITLLMKPHNVVLVPFAVFTSRKLHENPFKKANLVMTSYVLGNCYYFLQGHRNSLAAVDVSIGYIGLNDYHPLLVIAQVLIHTYAFPVLFYINVLEHLQTEPSTFWMTLVTLRTSVLTLTCITTVIFRHHLFIWSVFAPKLFIEGVHTIFLFIQITLWYCQRLVRNKICDL